MELVNWQDLYAANRAAIDRSAARPRREDPRHDMLVHVPATLPAGPAPLVVMLHGCTQDGAAFAAATRMNEAAERHGFVVAYPEQSRRANGQRCWNWFAPAHQARGRGEPERIAGAVRGLLAPGTGVAVDPSRVFVAGLSAGGAMAAVLANTHPDLFAAVAVHSGLAYRSAHDVGSAFAAMRHGGRAGSEARASVASIVLHGTGDRTVAPVNARQVLAQLLEPGLDPERPTSTTRGRADGGHVFTRAQWMDARGALRHELRLVEGLGHAWSGGTPGGSFTDPRGPDATEAIRRFFAAVGGSYRKSAPALTAAGRAT